MKHLNNWMRALRRSVLCACVAVACVWCLPSCNDDKIGDISLIYGRWEATSFSGYEKEEGEEPYEWNYGPSEMAGDYVIFNTDGTYVEGSSGTTGDSGTWRIQGNRIYVTSDGETIGASVPSPPRNWLSRCVTANRATNISNAPLTARPTDGLSSERRPHPIRVRPPLFCPVRVSYLKKIDEISL